MNTFILEFTICLGILGYFHHTAPLWHSGLTEADYKKMEALKKNAMDIIFDILYIDNKKHNKLGRSAVKYKNLLEIIGLPSQYDGREA